MHLQLLAHFGVVLLNLERLAARFPLGEPNEALTVKHETGRVPAPSAALGVGQNLSIGGRLGRQILGAHQAQFQAHPARCIPVATVCPRKLFGNPSGPRALSAGRSSASPCRRTALTAFRSEAFSLPVGVEAIVFVFFPALS